MQNPINDCTEEEGFYRNFYEIVDWFDFNPSDSDSEGQTKNEQSEKEAFESPGHDKSSHEIVSPILQFVQEEGADSIDQTDQNTVLYLTTMKNP